MKSKLKFFKNSKVISIDEFFKNVLYNKKFGYYSSKLPLGKNGDFVTSPKISSVFSEIIAIWMVATWESFGKPAHFNIVELGPGDGSLTKVLLRSFKKFPKFDAIKKIFLYETSDYLKKVQKKNILDKDVSWINDFNKIKKGPVIFFGNEFLDALPIKQFKKIKGSLFEKKYTFDNNCNIKEVFEIASKNNIKKIKSYKTLKKLNFIEFPKFGFQELEKIIKKIFKLKGCILIIDYGYLKPNNLNTLQSVMKHKKNKLLENLGKADVTSHVNFSLLKEFFLKKGLNVKDTINQRQFLKTMGIIERANIIAKKMKFSEKTDLFYRVKRLLSPNSMGNLFKVILAYKFNSNNFAGFN
jgi:cyclopropane-fatty-acyl-phospholipid synthase